MGRPPVTNDPGRHDAITPTMGAPDADPGPSLKRGLSLPPIWVPVTGFLVCTGSVAFKLLTLAGVVGGYSN